MGERVVHEPPMDDLDLFSYRIYHALATARGRYPQIIGLRTPKMPPRHRASAVDVCDRFIRRGWQCRLSDVEAHLKNLQDAGLLDRQEGGFAITNLDALREIAKRVDPNVKDVIVGVGQNGRPRRSA